MGSASKGPKGRRVEGIGVSVSGQKVPPNSFVVNTQALGKSQPSGTGPTKLGSPVFYDVSVAGVSDGTATISITNDSVNPRTRMQYWTGQWVDAGNQSVKGRTVTGEIPVRSLHGTPIIIGTL
jgi:hypothetical protein